MKYEADDFSKLVVKVQQSGSKALKYREQISTDKVAQRESIFKDWCDHVLSSIGCSSGLSTIDRLNMVMKLVSKVMDECSKATGTRQVNSLAMSQRLSQYVEFKGFDESICQDIKEIDDDEG